MAKSSLDKKFDQIREREESKSFSSKRRSRIVSKFVNNRLAVFGLIIFIIILLATILLLYYHLMIQCVSTSAQ